MATELKEEEQPTELTPEQQKRIRERELMESMFVRYRFRDQMNEGVAKREYNLTYYELEDGIKTQQLHWGQKSAYGNTTRTFSEEELKKYAYSIHPDDQYKVEKKKINRELRSLNKSIKQMYSQIDKLKAELIEKENRKVIVEQSLEDLNIKHGIKTPKPKSKRKSTRTKKRKINDDDNYLEDIINLQPPNKRQRVYSPATSMPPPLM